MDKFIVKYGEEEIGFEDLGELVGYVVQSLVTDAPKLQQGQFLEFVILPDGT